MTKRSPQRGDGAGSPKVPFVEFHAAAPKKLDIFLLKRSPFMMFFLIAPSGAHPSLYPVPVADATG